MNKTKFDKYSDEHIHFYDMKIPLLLEKAIEKKNLDKGFDLLDIGCGDGNLIYSLMKKELLTNVKFLVGVDLSPKRIEILNKNIENIKGIVSDACSVTELKENSFDIIIASQLIEHVKDDSCLIREIDRLLKTDGLAFISSVIKKPNAIYFYRVDGGVRIDPTHVREYSSKGELIDTIEKNHLKVIDYSIKKIKYPLIDLIIRVLINYKLLKPDLIRDIYEQNRIFEKLKKISIPIVGYYSIDTLCNKKIDKENGS